MINAAALLTQFPPYLINISLDNTKQQSKTITTPFGDVFCVADLFHHETLLSFFFTLRSILLKLEVLESRSSSKTEEMKYLEEQSCKMCEWLTAAIQLFPDQFKLFLLCTHGAN
jgi:hypothetical protein